MVRLINPYADGLAVLLLAGAGTAVEDEEDGLGVLATELLRDKCLVLAEGLGVKADIAGSVDTVNVAQGKLAFDARRKRKG